MKKKDTVRTVLVVISALLAAVLAVAFFQLISTSQEMGQSSEYGNSNTKKYSRHYVLIMEDSESESCQAILQGCRQEGELKDAYIELLDSDLGDQYTRLDLINMAIEMGVDGIIVEADESEEFENMINLADANNIPVVTVGQDCMDSKRISYVGIGGYDLGREYGREIIRTAQKKDRKVLIFMDKDADDSMQNIIYNGIHETLINEGNHLNMELEIVAVNAQSYFSADESIRNTLTNMEELPDFVVCLSEQDTMIMYNAIIEYNIVGELDVLGFYASENILQGIEKKILTSTVAINYSLMGEACVDALTEYQSSGVVNGYFLIDVHTINSNNIKEYMEREGD